jgi:hypothetical protein
VVINRAYAAPGTAVTVIWGRPGTSQREIRAVVTALPFKPDRRRVDVTAQYALHEEQRTGNVRQRLRSIGEGPAGGRPRPHH